MFPLFFDSFNSEGDTFEHDSEFYQETSSEGCSQSSEETHVHLDNSSFNEENFEHVGQTMPLDILPL